MTEQNTPKMTHDEMIDTLKGLVFGSLDRTTAKEREALNMAIKALEQEPKTGHWITLDYQKGKFECSECHTQGYVDTCMYKPIWEFCPRCGADMRGDTE